MELDPRQKNPKDWDVLDVQNWLRRTGYGKYCAQFLLEDTNGAGLLDMTKTSLLLLGVSDPGLLRAIQLLKNKTAFQLPVSDTRVDALIKELERTTTWLLRRIGQLYELPQHKAYELTKEILKFRPSGLPESETYGPGPNMFIERFSRADSVELLKESMQVPKTPEEEKPEITSLAELMKAASAASKPNGGPLAKKSETRRFADQSRFDLKVKNIRRNDRIILPVELRQDDEEDEADDQPASRTEQLKKLLIDENQVPPKYMFFPTDPIRTRFDLLMMLLVVYFSITTPLNLGFNIGLDSNIYVEMSLNFLFFADIVANFFTAYIISEGPNTGKLEIRYSAIARKYLKLWFWIDMVATVPIDLVISLAGGHRTGASLNKLIRLMRGFKLMRVMKMSRIIQRLMKRVRINPALFRIMKIIFALCFMWHCLGCFYWMVAMSESESESHWRPPERFLNGDFTMQYLRAFFWAVNCTMTIGTNIFPENNLEVIYTIFSICCGLIANALVIGSIKSAIEELDLASKVHRQDLEDLQAKLSLYQIPTGLKKKVLGYFRYLQSRYLDYTAEAMFKGLHPALREDLLLNLNQNLISQVPMFRDLPRACMLSIISKLQNRVYLPKEYIVMRGEKGLEMFFIVNGAVEAEQGESSRPIILRDGDYFCENNLMTTQRVDINYRALTYAEVCVLDRNSLKRLLQQFPAFALTMQRHMKQNMAKKKWAKVEHVFRLTHLIHKMGGDSDFSEAFASYNQGTLPGVNDVEVAKELLGEDLEPIAPSKEKTFSFSFSTNRNNKDEPE